MRKNIFIVFTLVIILFILFLNLVSFVLSAVPDADQDGIADVYDKCPGSATIFVDALGCSCNQKMHPDCSALYGGDYCCVPDDNPDTENCVDNFGTSYAFCNAPILDESTDDIVAEAVCGNGVIEPGEACDGTNLGAECTDFEDFIGGALKCTDDCGYDYSECTELDCELEPDFRDWETKIFTMDGETYEITAYIIDDYHEKAKFSINGVRTKALGINQSQVMLGGLDIKVLNTMTNGVDSLVVACLNIVDKPVDPGYICTGGASVQDNLRDDQTKTYAFNGKDYEVLGYLINSTAQGAVFGVNGMLTKFLQVGEADLLGGEVEIGVLEVMGSPKGNLVEFCFKDASEESFVCTDSDGGIEYYVAGTAESTDGSFHEDLCDTNGVDLHEGYCSTDGSADSVLFNCPNGCIAGVCAEQAPGQNIKDLVKYSFKETFLISDADWKNVLPLVPVTTWTDDIAVIKYPSLIFHQEDSSFDIDSIIYFLQQYQPTRVTIIGDTPQELDNLLIAEPELGAGLLESQLQRITANDYFSYWSDYKDIVYVEDNYESALMAATYASLINAPLVIGEGEPVGGYCGDGIIQPDEQCDGSNLGGTTCADLEEFLGGVLNCDSATCTFDTSECIVSYVCDDTDVNEEYPDGKNYYEKGITSGILAGPGDILGTQTDKCIEFVNGIDVGPGSLDFSCTGDNCAVEEFYCEYASIAAREYVAHEYQKCPNGCEDGACVAVGESGLVAYYKFDEGSGSVVFDETDYHNDGTIVGASWTVGKFGGALDFDGVDDYVVVPDSSSLDITDDITIAFWVNARSFANYPDLITKGDYTEAYSVWLSNFGIVHFELNNDAFPGDDVSLDKWYHLVVVRSGGDRKIYIDGEEVVSDSNAPASIGTTDSALTISTSDYPFDGLIDDVRIYNRALSVEEIQALLSVSECSDSDGGKDYYVKGYITNAEGIKSYDECNPGPDTTPNTLLEYYCTGDPSEPALGVKYECLNGCENGACVEVECIEDTDCRELSCPDGSFIHEQCVDNTCVLTEECPELVCSDSDGLNYYVKGFASIASLEIEDLCGPEGLWELYCNRGRVLEDDYFVLGFGEDFELLQFTGFNSNDLVVFFLHPETGDTFGVSVLPSTGEGTLTLLGVEFDFIVSELADGSYEVQFINAPIISADLFQCPYPSICKDGACVDVDESGLVAYYKFDEGSGTAVFDESDYHNDGTIIGASWTSGKFGGALDFDGVDDYVSVPDSSGLDISGDISVALWVYARSFSGYPDLVTKGRYDDAYSVWLAESGILSFALDYNDDDLRSSSALSTDAWYHVAVTRSGNERKIYINGEEDVSRTYVISLGTTDTALTISTSDYPFNGVIDEVRIYNKALSIDEIQALLDVPECTASDGCGETITGNIVGFATLNADDSKNIICVGDVTSNTGACDEQYTLEQLQQKYIEMTGTDKIMLVNPDDLSIKTDEPFQPEKSAGEIRELYTKTSLAAPFLASAKQEVIFSAQATPPVDYKEIDEKFKGFVEENFPNLIESATFESNNRGDKIFLYSFSDKELRKVSEDKLDRYYKSNLAMSDEYTVWLQNCICNYFDKNCKYQECFYIYDNNEETIQELNVDVQTGFIPFDVSEDILVFLKYNSSSKKVKLKSYNIRTNEQKEHQEFEYADTNYKLFFDGNHAVFDYIDISGQKRIAAYDISLDTLDYIDTNYLSFSFSGEWIAWVDNEFAVNAYNLLSKEQTKISDRGTNTAICENNLFFRDGSNLVLYDLLNKQKMKEVPWIDWMRGNKCYDGDVYYISQDNQLYFYNITSAETEKLIDYVPVYFDLDSKSISVISDKPRYFPVGGYLTVLASTKAIPLKIFDGWVFGWESYRPGDNTEYADFSGDQYPDMFAGRIIGFTSSDVSSYIARDLFDKYIYPEKKEVAFIASSPEVDSCISDKVENWRLLFEQNGYYPSKYYSGQTVYTFDPACWEDNKFIAYFDHGSEWWAGLYWGQIPDLANPVMINDACSTCSAVGEHGGSFCVRTLRKGALAYIGALNIAGVSTVYEEIINNIYHHGMSLAEAYTLAYSSTHYSTPYAALLGDPALNMNNPYLLNDAIMIDCND